MPELPEVEVTRASLADRLQGAVVHSLRLGKPLRWPLGVDPAMATGRVIGALQRRGKYLWMPLAAPAVVTVSPDPPERHDGGLLWHLGMSGSLNLSTDAGPPGAHDHADLHTSAGLLRLTDPRRFGAVVWSDGLDHEPALGLLSRLGAEPFDATLTAARFHAALAGRRVAIKQALLAGDIVVGAGNIYACEALFAAGIDPRTRANAISRPRAERLLAAVRDILAQAIALGGSTLRDFRDAHGMSGAFQHQAQVYDREGQACRRCGGTVRRIVQAQRSTYFCPHCQRR